MMRKVVYGNEAEDMHRVTYKEMKKMTGEQLLDALHAVQRSACDIVYSGNLANSEVEAAVRAAIPVGQSVEAFKDYTEKDYCVQYALLDRQNKFLDQLKALVSAVKITEEQTLREGYAVILIQFEEKRVQLRHFAIEKLEEATKYYSEVEKSVDDDNAAVVLVSVSDMQELQEAYPSYFLNAGEFIQSLQDFTSACKAKKYI